MQSTPYTPAAVAAVLTAQGFACKFTDQDFAAWYKGAVVVTLHHTARRWQLFVPATGTHIHGSAYAQLQMALQRNCP